MGACERSRARRAGRRLSSTYDYDGNGNRVATRRGESLVVSVSFDTLDRPHRRTRGERGRGYREVTFDYDAVGNPVAVTRGAGAERSTTVADYDGYGRLITILAPNGTAMTFSRDPNGNVLRQTVRGPGDATPVSETTQAFDAADRLIRRVTSAGDGRTQPSESWEFDARSRLLRRLVGADRSGGTLRRARPAGRCRRRIRPRDHVRYDGNSNVLEEVVSSAPPAGGCRSVRA